MTDQDRILYAELLQEFPQKNSVVLHAVGSQRFAALAKAGKVEIVNGEVVFEKKRDRLHHLGVLPPAVQ